jgi:adenylate cyclase
MKDKSIQLLVIPFLLTAAFALVGLARFYQTAVLRTGDILRSLQPSVPEDPALLLIDIDDLTIAKVGTWPLSRVVMADGLITMKEFGADCAVFDIEYVDPSPLGIHAAVLNQEIPDAFGREFLTIDESVTALFEALQTRKISRQDAEDYLQQLKDLTQASREALLQKVGGIIRDNDAYLGRAARYFENAFFTVNMLKEEDETASEELKAYTLEHLPNRAVLLQGGRPRPAADIRPAILPILQEARGAGFPNVEPDRDGVFRRIDLLGEYQGRYFGQLGFTPLLYMLGNPEIILQKGRLVLRGARRPGRKPQDIVIPLAEDGTMLINWPQKTYLESFRHISYYELVLHQRLEESLIHNLQVMREAGYLAYYRGETELLDPYQAAERLREEVLAGGDRTRIGEYRDIRARFFHEVGRFLTGGAEGEILQDIDRVLADGQVPEETKEAYRQLREEIPGVFANTREVHQGLLEARERLRKSLEGSFAIIGQTGTSTTDIGVNPFESQYMNVGTHAAVVNTILSGRFLDDAPYWIPLLVGLLASLVVILLIRDLRPLPSILWGMGVLILVAGSITAFLLVTGTYLDLVTPALVVFLTFLSATLIKFFRTEKEKGFLRNAFSHYLSTDVISELLADPSKLQLGGEKRYLTAIFTDVKGFSTISEALDATDLVKLLNAYLTEMSNIILEQRGTIDKYEGDAIISFFGAPVAFEDHAHRACLSAVRMRKMERILNERFLHEKISPIPLLTRIGINTGDMVVGNMGTPQKMDYTIMGNSVNLAARLEGVNKQYGTWVLISETTQQEAGPDFTVRKLDRVRVVGIQQPVRLYELVDEKAATEPRVAEGLGFFHHGLELFEKKAWADAQKQFTKALEALPEDGPAQLYIKRCKEYQAKPPQESWDGVFNLTLK